MQSGGCGPHGCGRFNGSHIMAIGRQPRGITTAACAYVEHGGPTPGQQIPQPAVDSFRVYRLIPRHDRLGICIVPGDRICHST